MDDLKALQPSQDAINSAVQELAQQQSRREIASNLDAAVDTKPDDAAYTQNLAKRAGVPLELVKGREKDVERELQLDDARISTINAQYPVLRESLKNPDFASITHDELDNLKALEDVAPYLGSGSSGIFQETAARFEQQAAFIGMLASAYGLGDDADIADFIALRSRAAAQVEKSYPGYVRQYERDAAMNPGFFGQAGAAASNPRAFARITGAQIPSTMALPIATMAGGSAAGTAVAPGPGTLAGGLGGLYAGSAIVGISNELAQQLQEKGVDTTDRAAVLSAISAPEFKADMRRRAEKYGLTMAAVDTMFGGVAGKFLNAAKGGTRAARIGGAAADIAIQSVGEGASEAAGQYVARGNVNTGDVFNEIAAGMGMSVGETVLGGHIRAEAGLDDSAIRAAASNAVTAKDAEITAINNAARNTKLAERNPDMLKAFMDKLSPGQNVFFDGQAASEFFQSLPPEKQDAIAGVMPDIVERIKEAVATGADIEISAGDYFAHIAPYQEADYLKSFIRFGDDDFSISQLQNIDDLVAAAVEDLDVTDNQGLEPGEQVQRRLETELQNAGRSLESARMEAQLARANIETLLQRYGDNEKAARIVIDAYKALTVRGVEQRRLLRQPINDLDLVIDSARREATGDKRAPAQPVERKYPALTFIKNWTGGVKTGSPLAAELEHLGVTKQTLPGLFKSKYSPAGLFGGGSNTNTGAGIDNIPASEWSVSDTPPEDGNGYVDSRHVLEAVAAELSGNPMRTAASMAEMRAEDMLLEQLGMLGVDIATASNAEIKAALNERSAREALAEELFQGIYGEKGARGSIQFLPDGETVINIFQDADLSTVLHEFGHFYWNLLNRLSEAGVLNEQGQKDWQTIRDYVGAEEGAALNVEQEEKIARAFEAYLLEGKAPSVDLQSAFQRFKAWLTRIYKTVAGLNVSINDDVRQVFDRLLASDEAIDAIRDNRLFRPDDNVLSILNKEQQETYIKQGEKSAQRAREKLFRKMLRQVERSKTEWWKAEREKLRAEIEKQVGASAVYKALDAMQKGQLPDGTPLGEPVRLSRKMLKEQFGEEILKYMPRATVEQSGGIDPNVAAEMFGFSSADAMVKAIINAEPKKQKVERLIDNEMLARHGDALRDGTLEREAVESFHNEDRAAQLAIELKAASEKAGMSYAKPEEFKAAAERLLGEKRVDEVTKSARYYYAEIRAARDFGRYSRAGNWPKAAEAKRKQLLNHYLYRLSQEADAEITKALRRFKKLEKPPVPGKVKIDEDYHNKIREVLAAFNFLPRISAQRQLRLELQAFAKWIEEKKNNDEAQLEVPLEILRASDKQHYRDLTLEEFRALRDMVYNIETQGRRKREYIINGEKRDLQAVVDQVLLSVEKALPVREMPMNPSYMQGLREKFMVIQVKAREYFRQLDSGNELGLLHDAILKPIDDGINQLTIRQHEASQKIEELLTGAYTREELRAMMRDKFEVLGLGNDLTKENLIMMALNWGNQGNREALLHGYQSRGWTFENVEKALMRHLDKRDWEFVQGVWDFIGSYWPEISKLERERKGFTPKRVESTPIDTAFGRFRGGYFPIVADPGKASVSNAQTLEDYSKDFKAGLFAGAATRRNHTKERVGVGIEARPLLLQTGVISRHINMVLRDITLGEAVFNGSKLLRNRDVRRAISERIGIEGYNALDLWLKDIAVGDISMQDFNTLLLDRIRANSTIAYMGFSLSTFVQQATGLVNSAGLMGAGGRGWKWVGIGLRKLMGAYTSGAGLTIAEIHDASEFMRMRHQTLNRDVNDALRLGQTSLPDGLSRTTEKYMPEFIKRMTDAVPPDYRKWFLWHIQKAQMLVDAATWLGAYDKAIEGGETEARAVTYADNIVRRSQASGLIQDLSGIERGTTSHATRFNRYAKIFTFMFSYFNAKFNASYGKIADYKAGRLSTGEFAVDMINLIWVEALLTAILTQNWPGDDDDSASETAAKWAWWVAKQPAQQVLWGRELTGAVDGFDSGGGPMGSFLKSTGNFSTQVAQGEADAAALKSTIGMAGVIFGIPSTQINRFINVIERADKGEEVGYIDFIRSRKPSER